jgi:hypothetical protein
MFYLYRCLLRLYPRRYFQEYAGEMAAVFLQAWESYRHRSLSVRVAFCADELWGVFTGALGEHLHYYDRTSMIRRFDMRAFRFPRSTIFLMALILVAVVTAIEKGRILSMQLATGNMNAPAVWSAIPRVFLGACAFMFAAGAIGYGLMFVLRRAGVQRFPNVQTWQHRK